MRLRADTQYPVLVVADDHALRKILHRLFSTEGFAVEVVADSLTGLDLLRQRSFSAVILDLNHPVSAEYGLCREIVDLIPDVPFVLLSASSDIEDRHLLLETGAGDYLTIPFSPKELATRLGALIQRSVIVV